MNNFVVVLDDGETYSSLRGCAIYTITDVDAFGELELTDKTIAEGEATGVLEYACDVSDLVPDYNG